MKKSLTILALSALTAGLVQADEVGVQANIPNRPARKVIIWDLHGVVLSNMWSPRTAVKAAVRKRGRKKGWLRSMNKEQWKNIAKAVFRKGHTSDDLYIASATKHDNPGMAELVTEIVNARKVNQQVLLRMQTLRGMGYENIVGSNIGANSFDNLLAAKPELKRAGFSGRPGVTVCADPTKPEDIVSKPSVEYFKNLLDANGLVADYDTVVFIDNDKKNVDGAVEAGLTGIHYKNARQLDQELAKVLPIGPQIGIFSQEEAGVSAA